VKDIMNFALQCISYKYINNLYENSIYSKNQITCISKICNIHAELFINVKSLTYKVLSKHN
jgi:hypothetical protein